MTDRQYNVRVVTALVIFIVTAMFVGMVVLGAQVDHQRVRYAHRSEEVCRSLTDFPQPASAYPPDDPQAVWLSNMFRTYC